MCLIKVMIINHWQTRCPRWYMPDGIPLMIGILKITVSKKWVKQQWQC